MRNMKNSHLLLAGDKNCLMCVRAKESSSWEEKLLFSLKEILFWMFRGSDMSCIMVVRD